MRRRITEAIVGVTALVLVVLGVPLAVWLFSRWTKDRWTGERRSVPKSVGVAVLVVAAVWGVGRNLAGI